MPRYLHAHPSDKPNAHLAADMLGKLLAQGLMSFAEIVNAIAPETPDERMRLTWTLLDSASEWELRRDRAEREIAYRIAPLIEAMQPADAILGAARAVNEQNGECLLYHEITAQASSAMARKLRRGR